MLRHDHWRMAPQLFRERRNKSDAKILTSFIAIGGIVLGLAYVVAINAWTL